MILIRTARGRRAAWRYRKYATDA